MKKTALKRKINRKRYVKSQILKYIRENLEIIEDLASDHTGYFYIKDHSKKWLCLIDWEGVYFIEMTKVPPYNVVKREDIIKSSLAIRKWFK
jgi:hypothetical protein